MARFVLAGKADCPHFAKAERLGEQLVGSLPHFRLHKVLVPPDEWQDWLDDTCRSHGWRHSGSPLVWRELVHRGGKGMLLGGLADFLEHCQEYYGVTSDMSSDMMLKVAVETCEMEERWEAEQRRQAGLLRPLHVWIGGALNPTCSILIPHLLSEHIFPWASSSSSFAVSLHLLHLEGEEEALHTLRVETEELGLALLHQVTAHTALEEAFRDADLVILLDEEEEEEETGDLGGGGEDLGGEEDEEVREEDEEVREVEEVREEVEEEVRQGDEEKEVVSDEKEVREVEEREKVEVREGDEEKEVGKLQEEVREKVEEEVREVEEREKVEEEVREGDEEKEVGKLQEETENLEKEEGEVRAEKEEEEKDEEGRVEEGQEKVEEREDKVEEERESTEEQDEEAEAMTEEEAEEARRRKLLLRRISARYRRYGQLIGCRGRGQWGQGGGRGVRVVVAGDAHLNLKCALLAESGPAADPGVLVVLVAVAVATPLENAARARIAQKLDMRTADVRGVCVWGDPGGTFAVDLQRARVFNHPGAVQGPGSFARPLLEVLHDRTWLKTTLPELLKGRGGSSPSATSSAVSVAHGILTVLEAWNGVSRPGEEGRVLSLGVRCQGHPHVPDGMVCSVPVTLSEDGWRPVLEGVHMGGGLEETLRTALEELRREREEAG